jgi:hypothetical protein
MYKNLDLKIPVFLLNIPLLDNEFDTDSQETFSFIMAQAEFETAEHEIRVLN